MEENKASTQSQFKALLALAGAGIVAYILLTISKLNPYLTGLIAFIIILPFFIKIRRNTNNTIK